MKYFEGKVVIEEIKCVSWLGLCIYKLNDFIFKVMGGLGVVIVFIDRGVMIDWVVCVVGVGGEVFCYVF